MAVISRKAHLWYRQSSLYHACFLAALFVLFSLVWLGSLSAEERKPLPSYVIEEFGKPPDIPKGPLSKDIQTAVKMAFVDAMKQSVWGRDQTVALNEIVQSKDPRLVWIIADLMRFTAGQQLHDTLAEAASLLLGKESREAECLGRNY